MALASLLEAWQSRPEVAHNIVAWRSLPSRPAQFEALPTDLHPLLAAALRSRGIDRLYSHQATAWAQIRAGNHPVVVTGTASGKTLCYTLPVTGYLPAPTRGNRPVSVPNQSIGPRPKG